MEPSGEGVRAKSAGAITWLKFVASKSEQK